MNRKKIKKAVKRLTIASFGVMVVSGAFVLGANHGKEFRNFRVVR